MRCVSREMTFFSPTSLSAFHLTQSLLLHSALIERWSFSFGFVIPHSTNSWQCTIDRAQSEGQQPQPHLTPEALSGNLVIETKLWDGDDCVGVCRQRVYYDAKE